MSDYPAPPSQWSSSASAPEPEPHRSGWLFGSPLASWPRRSVATLIDFGVTIWLPTLIFGNVAKLWFISILILVGGNSVFMQARTGQSLGKVLLGVQLVWPVRAPGHGKIAAYPSLGLCTARVLLHSIDIIFFGIGFLRPLWNWKRQTFADSITKTVVLADKPPLALEPAPQQAKSLLD